jgi:hypothetical protein
MSEGNTTQIRINNRLVGIIGLRQVMEKMADKFALRLDEEIGSEMILRLSESNYIPNSAMNLYISAFVR